MQAYLEDYLDDAMHNLGECADYIYYEQHMNLNDFFSIFATSSAGLGFETGHPKYVCGMSGTELAYEVLLENHRVSLDTKWDSAPLLLEKSDCYWAGWVLAYTQWKYALSWEEIFQALPFSQIVMMYHPYHEASEDKFADDCYEMICAKRTACRRLQEYRKRLGMSQSQLAKAADVNLRTLQQYEIGAKDLKKAEYMTVISLARALHCQPEQLFF